MSVVNIKLSDAEDGSVGVVITATNPKEDSKAMGMAVYIQCFITDLVLKAEKADPLQDHPLLPKKELILPDSLTH